MRKTLTLTKRISDGVTIWGSTGAVVLTLTSVQPVRAEEKSSAEIIASGNCGSNVEQVIKEGKEECRGGSEIFCERRRIRGSLFAPRSFYSPPDRTVKKKPCFVAGSH